MRYDNWKWGVERFKPNHMVYQALALLPVLMIFIVVVVFAPDVFMLEQQPADPMTTPLDIKPEWYFLPAYQALKMAPEPIFKEATEFVGIAVQMVFLLGVILLPFLDCNPRRHPRRRPIMMAIGLVAAVIVVGLGVMGHYAPPPIAEAGG